MTPGLPGPWRNCWGALRILPDGVSLGGWAVPLTVVGLPGVGWGGEASGLPAGPGAQSWGDAEPSGKLGRLLARTLGFRSCAEGLPRPPCGVPTPLGLGGGGHWPGAWSQTRW